MLNNNEVMHTHTIIMLILDCLHDLCPLFTPLLYYELYVLYLLALTYTTLFTTHSYTLQSIACMQVCTHVCDGSLKLTEIHRVVDGYKQPRGLYL